MVYFRWRMVGKQKRIFTAFTVVLVLFSFLTVNFVTTAPAYAQPATGGASGSTTTPTGTKCAIERIGWILCPIIEGSAKVADFSFQFLANHLLSVEPELLTTNPQGGKGTITAWEQARNIANIMFAIAFVIIVYSQITGSGLNNYGIKRMLPRLILAAIAVNVSYYICQTIVDLSNILGYTIMKALTDIAKEIGPQVMSLDPNQGINGQSTSTGGILASIAVASLAVVGIIWLLLPILGSIVVFVLVTCITIILILLLRKAVIVLLVVISPLAFVMYLLPNTEKYFSKWLDMFWKLLLVFPIVALLMGSGQVASTIILAAGAEGKPCDPTANTNGADADASKISKDAYTIEGECSVEVNGKQVGATLGLVATGIAVAPLIAVWSVLQGALSAAGTIGGKIGGAINGMQGRQRQKLGKSLAENGEFRRNQLNSAALRGDTRLGRTVNRVSLGSARRGARRRAQGNYAKAALNADETKYIADNAVTTDETGQTSLTSFGKKIAGGALASDQQLARVKANAINAQAALEAEEVKTASAQTGTMQDTVLRTVVENGDMHDPAVAAAIQELSKRQDFDGLEKAINKFGKGGVSLASKTLGDSLSQNNPGFFTAGNIGDISRGALKQTDSYQSMAAKNIADGVFSQEKMAESGPSVLAEASFIAGRGPAGTHNMLQSAAQDLMNDPQLVRKTGRNQQIIADLNMGTIKRTRGQ